MADPVVPTGVVTKITAKLAGIQTWWSAANRSVYMFLGGATFLFGLIGLTGGDQSQILTAVHQIGDGVSGILTGLGTLIVIIGPLIAKFKSSPAEVVKTAGQVPGVTVGVTTDAPPAVQAVARSKDEDASGVGMVSQATATKIAP